METKILPEMMKAVICDSPGPVSVLQIRETAVPVPHAGQVLVKILGFGINRAEMFTRQGHSPGVSFPRIIGIECIGTIAAHHESIPKDDALKIGTRIATCMGGLGRQMPGSHAEYVCVPVENVRSIPQTNLSVATLASLPEMIQTTYGSLTAGLDLQPGESILIRGATSSIGICAIQMARYFGASFVAATTRNSSRIRMLRDHGANEVYIDNGDIASEMSTKDAEGFDKVLELVDTTTLHDSLRCTREKGTVCMTGIQGGEWELAKFLPFEDLPNRVRLSVYSGGPEDFRRCPWEQLVKAVEKGEIKVPVRAFRLDEIQTVHEILESGGGGEKLVIAVAED